ncbi:hypothetical protein T265_03725 [Opisthorchis viverrini]|uniref:Uncharacterized protein n=1 Tax=Opisthorchis viverrini TaxID=6198 RepID=A0A074ZQP2_OPIVI|nr:hypothetical protein T265_03725 [Opisthorchis viverrini]KER29708.1 hypothetical protein T265_03725 [Opisthorchis viverrini]
MTQSIQTRARTEQGVRQNRQVHRQGRNICNSYMCGEYTSLPSGLSPKDIHKREAADLSCSTFRNEFEMVSEVSGLVKIGVILRR